MLYTFGDDCPSIDDSAFIAASADIIGAVIIKAQASVWFNAVIRGDCDLIELGARSNIQDGAVVHADVGQPMSIGEDVTVGHHAMLHGRSIGDRTLIGINAVMLDGARIGSDCLIGANTLIKAGSDIPDGSMVVGSPGKIIRQIDAQTRAFLLHSARHYVDAAASMKVDCREVVR
jgi:carbonic anhydrase/acetyltransferase-like protein (isoleucine patch superfamily)